MYTPGLFDGSFPHQRSATLGGENDGLTPQLVEWQREAHGAYSTFYTDLCLDRAIGAPGLKVAWLLEPPSLHSTHYIQAARLEDYFDYILTFNARLLNRSDKWLYYPLGGSWIATPNWGAKEKSKQLSIIASQKTGAVGHRLRHQIVRQYGDRMDVWGRGYTPVESKQTALAPYRYSLVIESIRMDAYFSEKLIDCMSQGTVPIYWGCPSIADFFDPAGIIQFRELNELPAILDFIGKDDYEVRTQAIHKNMLLAKKYTIAEDWVCRHYPFLVEGAHV